jgi:hypothetical protein
VIIKHHYAEAVRATLIAMVKGERKECITNFLDILGGKVEGFKEFALYFGTFTCATVEKNQLECYNCTRHLKCESN